MQVTRVLKRDKIHMAGTRCLELPEHLNADGPQPTGRIVQQNDQGAVIEVTCTCGNTFRLNCTYAPPGGAGP